MRRTRNGLADLALAALGIAVIALVLALASGWAAYWAHVGWTAFR